MKVFLRTLSLFVGIFFVFTVNTVWAELTIGNYTLVSSKRVSRVEYEYTYRAQVTNDGESVKNVLAQVTSNSPYTTVIEGVLNFVNVAYGTAVNSSDTFIIKHDRRYPMDWSVLTWDVQGGEAVDIIGPEGGEIVSEDGLKAIVPQMDLNQSIIVSISTISSETLSIPADILEGTNLLKVFRLDLSVDSLSDNIDFSIPKPDYLNVSEQIFLAKIYHLPDKDILIPVDLATIIDDEIVTHDPGFPGATVPAIYALYTENFECGVPDYSTFFNGKVIPSCRDKLNLHHYFKVAEPLLNAKSEIAIARQNEQLTKDHVIKLWGDIAANYLSIYSIATNPVTSIDELWLTAGGESAQFASKLYEHELLSDVWIPIITCASKTIIYEDYSACLVTGSKEIFDSIFNFWEAYDTSILTKRINETVIAKDFLQLYFSYGENLEAISSFLEINTNSDLLEIIQEHAEKYKDGLFSFDDYKINNVYDVIFEAIQTVFNFGASVDPDYDGIHKYKDNCAEIFNPEQIDIDDDNLGDVCDVCPNDPLNLDTDLDEILNCIDEDDDDDGYLDINDQFPLDEDEWADFDQDGIGDNADIDDDNDGVNDDVDQFPYNSLESADSDFDGIGNNSDNCPDISNPNQADADGDNIGNACENDITLGLKIHIPFEGNADDYSGNNHGGIGYGGVAFTEGVIGQASSYDGINDYFRILQSEDFNFDLNDSYSISLYLSAGMVHAWDDEQSVIEKWFANADTPYPFVIRLRDEELVAIMFDEYTDEYSSGLASDRVWSSDAPIMDRKWHHVVVVKNGTQYLRLYIDGILIAEDNDFHVTKIYNEDDLYIGARGYPTGNGGNNFLHGEIDELRIYNRVITEDEIQELFLPISQFDSDSDGIADIYDNCSDVPNADQGNFDFDRFGDACDNDDDNDGYLDVDDVFPLDATEWADFDQDSIGDNADLDDDNDGVNDDTDLFPYDPNETTDSDGDGVGDNSDNCPGVVNPDQADADEDGIGDACDLDLNRGLVAYYPFNGNANDESGNGNDAIIFDAALTSDRFGNPNNAYNFDGNDDYLLINNPAALNIGLNDASIALWINFSEMQPFDWEGINLGGIAGKGYLSENAGHGLYVADGKIQYQIRQSTLDPYGYYYAETNSALDDGAWHFVVGTVDRDNSTGIMIYVDGNLQQTTGDPTGLLGINLNDSNSFTIGARSGDYNLHFNYLGKLDDIRIYNRALSGTEIQELYNEGGITDYDGDGILDDLDNCPYVFNPDQIDTNGDDIGDLCDSSYDNIVGEWLITRTGSSLVYQAVFNEDGTGTINGASLSWTVNGSQIQFVWSGYNPTTWIGTINETHSQMEGTVYIVGLQQAWTAIRYIDTDEDDFNDLIDNCPYEYNPGQDDLDRDKIGDACDNFTVDLIGDWSITRSDFPSAIPVTINEDGTGTFNGAGMGWTVTGNQVTFTISGPSNPYIGTINSSQDRIEGTTYIAGIEQTWTAVR